MRSGNPALQAKNFANISMASAGSETMSIHGTVNKSLLMLFIIVAAAGYTWGTPDSGLIFVELIGGLITAFVTIFKKHLSMYTAPLYALFEGLLLGGVSYMFELQYPGIVMQAVLLTFGTCGALLMAYKSGLIPVTQNFKLGIVAATGGIFVTYLLAWILSFFGINMSIIFGGGTFGILFSLFVVIIAALNLVLDFDFIEDASQRNLPKYMEWYAAFGLMVTLIWLYLEFLRLIAKSRD